MKKLLNALTFIRKYGIHGFAKECYYRYSDSVYEKHFGVSTIGPDISKEDLGVHESDSIEHSSISYKHIINALNSIPIESNKITLLDYGCGKGRVLISAAREQYKQLIGVELSNLIDVAKNNLDGMKHRRTQGIKLLQRNAMEYIVPSDVNVIYFYNPFVGSTLTKVTENIYSSYSKYPRKIYIIYFNNEHFDEIVSDQGWLAKKRESTVHLNTSFGLYETIP